MRINTVLWALLFLFFSSQGGYAQTVAVEVNRSPPCNEDNGLFVGTDSEAERRVCNVSSPGSGVTGRHVSALSATAEFGSLGVGIGMFVSKPAEEQGTTALNARFRARASFAEQLTVISAPPRGFIVIDFGLNGTLATARNSGIGPEVFAEAFGTITVNGTGLDSGLVRNDEIISENANTIAATIAYINSSAGLIVDLEGSAQCAIAWNNMDDSQDCTAIVGLGSTLNVLSASVFDEDMNPVPDATVVSQSGFDYQAGVAVGDDDQIPDATDNCTMITNPAQIDTDGDGIGNSCDPDLNNDCTVDFVDRDIFIAALETADPDADFNGDGVVDPLDQLVLDSFLFQPPGPSGLTNACDVGVPDADDDGVSDDDDLCPGTTLAAVVDGNGCSDAQVDGDGDGICTAGAPSIGPSECTGSDNCPVDVNPGQEDLDGDQLGDACDTDTDGDGVLNDDDNCPIDANPDQADSDQDGIGDICDDSAEGDADNDHVLDGDDVCPATVIPEAVPTSRLGWYRWTLDNPDGSFTQRNPGRWSHFSFTTEDTRGCSCEQIIAESRLPRYIRKINRKYGCSTLLMLHWVRNP